MEEKANWRDWLSKILTGLLICSTILCFYVVFQSMQNQYVSFFGHSFYYVVSGSMEPTIMTGALVVTEKADAKELEIGDIIVFLSRNEQIYNRPNTHRIIEIQENEQTGEREFITQGDANNVADEDHVQREDILGRVVGHTGALKSLGTLLAFFNTRVGFLLVILLPIALVTISLLKRFTREFKDALRQQAEQVEKQEAAHEYEDEKSTTKQERD